MKPKSTGPKIYIYVFVGIITALIGYKLVQWVFEEPTCDVPSYRLVKVKGANGKLDMQIFMYGHQDEMSDEVDARASQRVRKQVSCAGAAQLAAGCFDPQI